MITLSECQLHEPQQTDSSQGIFNYRHWMESVAYCTLISCYMSQHRYVHVYIGQETSCFMWSIFIFLEEETTFKCRQFTGWSTGGVHNFTKYSDYLQLMSGSSNQPLLIANSVCHSAHDSLFPDHSYPNLPTLGHIVLLWYLHVLPLLSP